MLLGSIWLVLEPMLSVATYYLVFEVLLNRTGGVTNFIGFLAVGQMFFANHRRGVTRTASSLKRSEQMLRSFTFPHLVFPVADAIDGFLSFLFMLPVVIVLLVATGETVSLLWILVIPLAAIQLVQTLGVGLLLARFFTRVPDLQVVLENLFRALLFLSGVFWSIDRFTDGENGDLLLRIFSLNPVYCFLEVGRWILMDDRPEPVSWILVSLVVWTVVAASAGLFVFFRGEKHHSGSYRVAKLDS